LPQQPSVRATPAVYRLNFIKL